MAADDDASDCARYAVEKFLEIVLLADEGVVDSDGANAGELRQYFLDEIAILGYVFNN